MKRHELFIPWVIACLATLASIFFSAVKHHAPCTLCWYQRIFLFPLVIILGIAAFRNAYRIIYYVLPLSLLGLALATYHVVMVHFYTGGEFCLECTIRPISPNPILFPFLSMLTFLAITVSLIWILIRHHNSKKL